MSVLIEQAVEHWEFVSPLLRKPKSEADYDVLVEAYDLEHWPIPEVSGVEVLRSMMQEHGLTQSDLPGVGPQSVVSEILSGKRQLNVRQIRWLAEHFKVPVDMFI
ncbi:type II toxin-antitoxin system HigA family antitoxin [Pseudomonas sp. LG1D9]|uniref:helix-turn-helix domain-containing protein n=1 Tax=Pseudomonas sp. LG1D9 TaxID=2083054 RepID=UPI000CF351CA|nr:transcriptional regulator [Pseudomonas sp. LG1D9]